LNDERKLRRAGGNGGRIVLGIIMGFGRIKMYVRATMKSFGLDDLLAAVSLVSDLLGLDRSSSAILQI